MMISNHQEDEFVAVRVQDPRVQNEGSWNSYVDYKIFLHTNSKAFTAKTSCVRRRYSEFVWLKKKLQKNAGLVPVPELPGKSLFYFNNEDFLERRRKGLQLFLDKVVHMTVCLSDSQLHLFLQTQLPVGHIQDCVQGHTPYSVTDAILTYASSNQGLAQAQEDDLIKDPCLTVSYESMESPAPRQPHQQSESFSPELLSCGDPNPLRGVQDQDSDEVLQGEKSSVRISQKSNHLEVVLEDSCRPEATFYLGDSSESVSSAEQVQQRIQTPVEVHSSAGSGFEDSVSEGEVVLPPGDEEKLEQRDSNEADERKINSEPEKCDNSVEILDFKENYCKEQVLENDARCQEAVEDVCTENPVISEGVLDVRADEQTEPGDQKGDESGRREETALESEIHDEALEVNSVPAVENDGDDAEGKQEVDFAATRDESDEGSKESCSLPSSDESIVKVSDEEADDPIQVADSFAKMSPEDDTRWAEVEASSRSTTVAEQHLSAQEDEDLQYILSSPSKSADLSSAATSGDMTENGDFSILATSHVPGLADNECVGQEAPPSPSEETQEVEAH
ncbi:sorting nexin-11 [Archocentrus centrarchus]|uniref:sorting nexin-11 n=1 Tax=Archocentrus centrarchus TaxID=63155 RepID=UPI0011EA52CA|nr:sorting nexin-11 [Archocentrus centrarchus]